MGTENSDERSISWLLLKLAVFTVCVPGTATVWLPLYVLFPALRQRPIEWNAATAGAIVLMAAGASGYLWCALEFAFVGRGTPAPIDMPRRLVVQGLYRYVRNPMYISALLVLVGESALFRSWHMLEYSAVIAIGFHFFVLFHEEPTLRRKMGPEYVKYCEDVARWSPRLTRRRRGHAV